MPVRVRASSRSAPPPPPSRWRLDLAAALLLVAGLGVSAALFSHDPADPPGATVWPANARPTNLLGPPGAWMAHGLKDGFGPAAYVLLAAWLVPAGLLLLRPRWWTWLRRLAGWLLAVPLAALCLDRAAPALEGLPPAGAGGSVGAWLSLWLDQQFAPPWQGLVLAAAVLLCLVLTAERILWWALRGLGRLARLAWREGLSWPAASDRDKAPRAVAVRWYDDEEDEEEKVEDEPDEEVPGEAAPEDDEPVVRSIPIRHHDRLRGDPAAANEPAGLRRAAPRPTPDFAGFELPPLTLLEDPEPPAHDGHERELRERATLLEKTFLDFGLKVRVVGINTGPVVTQYEIALDVGLRVSKVTGLADDVALNLRVPSVRIVAPIPGRNTVGVEVPNEQRARVRLKEVLLAAGKKVAAARIPLLLGKDAEGRPLVQDLADMPHLLIAGSTGTGKSVCMNAIILSVLMTRRPDEVRMVMIDPKFIEMDGYSRIPHLMSPVISNMDKAEAVLAWAVDKMEERYELLRRARVRNLAGYNELPPGEALKRIKPDDDERERIPERMPHVVIFIDEMAELMMQKRKEVEGHVIRLAQKSRAAGIHLVVATQKPTVDVITGLIKSNLPSRVCFKVVNKSDSRVVLDAMGADKLLGKGDMLFLPPGSSDLVRAQCTFASDTEINGVVEFLETDEPCYAEELMHLPTGGARSGDLLSNLRQRDDLYEAAVEVVIREQRGSVSLLQRTLGIGYGKAARFIDFMAEDGIVGPYNGSNAREVVYSPEQWEQLKSSAR